MLRRLLGALVRLLPAGFRYDFGAAIDADLDRRAQAGDRARLMTRDLPSLAGAVVREHSSALGQDVRYALRTMRRTPGFTAMAVVMLALGTGVNVAMFSIVDAMLLRSPFPHPERIVQIRDVQGSPIPSAQASAERYRRFAADPGPFAAVAAFTGGGSHVTTATGDLRRLDVECVSASMFDVLGVAPLIGRPFGTFDDRPDASPVMVLSHPFWRRLGSSPAIVGSTLTVNQTPVTVIGVMPRFFAGPLSRSDTEAWLPMHRPVSGGGSAGCPAGPVTHSLTARIAPGLSLDQARAQLAGLDLERFEDSGWLDGRRRQFVTLSLVVLSVLLIACFNVGGLQMERTLARRRELAVRLAMGASRGRLARQVITENVVLALAGAIGGSIAAGLSLDAMVALMPGSMPYAGEIRLNARVLMVTLAGATAAGVIAGLLPLLQTRRLDPAQDLSTGARSAGGHGEWTRRVLVIVEVAISVVVLIGAGLTIRTFLALRPTEPGFDPAHKITTRVSLAADTPDARRQFVTDVAGRLRATQGVRAVTFSTYLPLSGFVRVVPAVIGGAPRQINTGYVTPEFFDVMKIPLRAGRAFTTGDTAASAHVAIVDETLASLIRPDGQVLGERIALAMSSSQPASPPVERLIVGIVAGTRYSNSDLRQRPMAWMPYAQDAIGFVGVIVESDGRPASALAADVRGAIRALRPDVAPADPELLTAMLDRSMSSARFSAWLLGVFAALAVGLAAMGLMATVGWWVHQRTRELGVRLALGATRAELVRLVARQGLLLAGAGIAAGCLAATGLTRVIAGRLYGVTPLDLPTFVAGAAAMSVVAAAAILVPVRRATAIDPAVVLKAE